MRLAMFFSFLASGFAQNALNDTGVTQLHQPGVIDNLEFGGSYNFTLVNPAVTETFGDLNKAPLLYGTGYSARLGGRVTNRVHLYATYDSSGLKGVGPWEPKSSNSQEAAAGVVGTATGTVRTNAHAWGAVAVYDLHKWGRNGISVEGGAAFSSRTSDFNGNFTGFDGQSTFTVPATNRDISKGVLPVVHFVYGYQVFEGMSAQIAVGTGFDGFGVQARLNFGGSVFKKMFR